MYVKSLVLTTFLLASCSVLVNSQLELLEEINSLRENICRDLPRALDLFCFNATEFQRYRITYNFTMTSVSQRRCERTAARLRNPTRNLRSQGINASVDVSDCISAVKLIAGSLNIQALQYVCRHPSASVRDNVFVVHEPTSSDLNLCTILSSNSTTPTPTPPCNPDEGCIPTIIG